MKRLRLLLLAVLIYFSACVVMHAQIGGCEDSPEAPTDVLMLVGSIGMVYGSSVVMKMLRGRRKQ